MPQHTKNVSNKPSIAQQIQMLEQTLKEKNKILQERKKERLELIQPIIDYKNAAKRFNALPPNEKTSFEIEKFKTLKEACLPGKKLRIFLKQDIADRMVEEKILLKSIAALKGFAAITPTKPLAVSNYASFFKEPSISKMPNQSTEANAIVNMTNSGKI